MLGGTESDPMRRCQWCGDSVTQGIHLCQIPKGTPCKASDVLQGLQNSGKLIHLSKAIEEQIETWKVCNRNECHRTAFSLIEDLTNAGKTEGWFWCYGYVWNTDIGKHIEHSWLECDGWSIDSSFLHCTVMVIKTDLFQSSFSAETVEKRGAEDAVTLLHTPNEFDEWCMQQADKLSLYNAARLTRTVEQKPSTVPSKPWWKIW